MLPSPVAAGAAAFGLLMDSRGKLWISFLLVGVEGSACRLEALDMSHDLQADFPLWGRTGVIVSSVLRSRGNRATPNDSARSLTAACAAVLSLLRPTEELGRVSMLEDPKCSCSSVCLQSTET